MNQEKGAQWTICQELTSFPASLLRLRHDHLSGLHSGSFGGQAGYAIKTRSGFVQKLDMLIVCCPYVSLWFVNNFISWIWGTQS